MKRVIITADDFGRSPEINRAVIEAHQNGILTCASLMVAGAAAEQAVSLAKANPTLRVGLHMVLVDGYSVLSHKEIPDLVDSSRRFHSHPATAGWRYFFSRRVKRQLIAECKAQIEKFLAAGLSMDHLNSHHHLHIHPTIAGIVIDLARQYAIPAARLPFQGLRTLTGKSAIMAAVMFPWVAFLKLRLSKAGIAHNREIFGLYESGTMVEETWLRLIPKIKPGTTEIFCHPAIKHLPGQSRFEVSDLQYEEFNALISPAVKDRLENENAILTGFNDSITACANPTDRGWMSLRH